MGFILKPVTQELLLRRPRAVRCQGHALNARFAEGITIFMNLHRSESGFLRMRECLCIPKVIILSQSVVCQQRSSSACVKLESSQHREDEKELWGLRAASHFHHHG